MIRSSLKELKRFEKDTEQCMKCGFCTYVCPIYQVEKIESGVARGKNELVKALLRGDLQPNRSLGDRLYKCTACLACTESCPSKAPIPRVVVAARADMVRSMGVRFPYGLVYRNLLTNRRLLGNLLRLGGFFQSAFMPATNGTIRHLPGFVSAITRGKCLPSIPRQFLRHMVEEDNKPPQRRAVLMRIGYFAGCMHEFILPHIGKKTVDFLIRSGMEVAVPRAQVCCGAAVFLGAGDFETGRKIADVNVAAFSDVDYIVTDCATCACALKEYSRFLGDNPEKEESYRRFAGKVVHVSQFLIDVLDLPASAFHPAAKMRGKRITWHDPCHLNRHLGVKQQPRRILQSLAGVHYVEMPEAGQCCGMAGQFSLLFDELSQKIAERKIENIGATNADIVVTECPGCRYQLMDNLARLGKPLQVMSLMESIN